MLINQNEENWRLETILGLTAFAAGSVDIISFTGLGGIFASAMTGNLAFLGLYLARGSFAAAFGSAIALFAFMAGVASGVMIARGKAHIPALRFLLTAEVVLLASAAAAWFATPHRAGGWPADLLIMLLAAAMGLQSVLGKAINLSNIPTVVFTTTLTNIVMALSDMVAHKNYTLTKDTARQLASFLLYFVGAFCAGLLAATGLGLVILLPLLSAGAALAIHVAGGVKEN